MVQRTFLRMHGITFECICSVDAFHPHDRGVRHTDMSVNALVIWFNCSTRNKRRKAVCMDDAIARLADMSPESVEMFHQLQMQA